MITTLLTLLTIITLLTILILLTTLSILTINITIKNPYTNYKDKEDALVCLPHTLTPLCVDLSGDRVERPAKEQHCYNLR